MALPADKWDAYLTWNNSIADVIYPFGNEAPAYMDLESDELAAIAERAGYSGPDPDKALGEVVRSVVVDWDNKLHLRPLVFRTTEWKRRGDRDVPPPCLAFLAVTALAAEDMGQSDDKFAPNAYYPRLARRLGVPTTEKSIEAQYRKYAEFFWQCLNTWLESNDGLRGLPTAYALTHRYVGLPMSQALIREGDRRKFPEMFMQYGLSPGMQVAPEALTGYLDDWLRPNSHAPGNLIKLWQRPTSHERIASIAAVELSNWDGSLPETDSTGGHTTRPHVGLVVNLRSSFRGSSLELALGLRLPADADGNMFVRSSDGSWLPINLAPGIGGLWRTSYTESIDAASMLEGVVRIRGKIEGDAPEFNRFPRHIVPLTYDELQSAFVESERLQLGVDSLLLVRTRTQNQPRFNIAAQVKAALQEAARPGFEVVESLKGLPEGWLLFKNVQLFRTPSTSLNELVPIAQNQLAISGGFRIPARIRKWSTFAPPEIRAIAQTESHVRVTLSRIDSDEHISEWESDEGALVAPLKGLPLRDADYRISLYVGAGKDPVQQASIRLRSSRTVDVFWSEAPRLVYSLDHPLGAVRAIELSSEGSASLVDGLCTSGEQSGIEPTISATATVDWGNPKPTEVRTPIQLGTPDPSSCVVTGAHYLEYPPYRGGWQPKYIDGTCRYCGLVKRSPTWKRKTKNNQGGLSSTCSTVVVKNLPRANSSTADWEAALDAIRHLGGGPASSLNQIALQLEGTALFADTFRRSMETLGHIAVEYDELWRPVRWEVSPPCLAQTADGSYRFVGFWTPDDIMDIAGTVAEYGGQYFQLPSAEAPLKCGIIGIGDDVVELLAASHTDVTIVPNAGMRMLRSLPRLSDVAAALPRKPMAGFDSAEIFDVASASWAPTVTAVTPGAYRLRRGFETLYIVRSLDDIESSTMAVGTPTLVKHIAANMLGKRLLSYQKQSKLLLVPLGAELPGLYGRAIVALSGELPQRKTVSTNNASHKTVLAYEAVNKAAADLLATLLSS